MTLVSWSVLSVIIADETAIEERGAGFKAGYGSILYFGDNAVVDGWGAQMPAYHGVRPGYISTGFDQELIN